MNKMVMRIDIKEDEFKYLKDYDELRKPLMDNCHKSGYLRHHNGEFIEKELWYIINVDKDLIEKIMYHIDDDERLEKLYERLQGFIDTQVFMGIW